MSLFERIFRRYQDKSIYTRFFIWGRWNICPFETLATLIPDEGRMAELGCGIGLFSNAVSFLKPKVTIDAYDENEKAIQTARKSTEAESKINFINQDVKTLNIKEMYDSVAMIDVVHHIPRASQSAAFDVAWNMLKPNGMLILKEVDDRPWWRVFLAYWHDLAQMNRPYLLARTTLKELIIKKGFTLETERKMDMLHIPHMAYVARKATKIG